jgi:hypothetical protein
MGRDAGQGGVPHHLPDAAAQVLDLPGVIAAGDTDMADPVATVNRRIPEERKSNEAILPGTRLVRVWNDRRYEVTVLADGYEFEGRTFRSLSAVAREITGTRWNGKVFFGLKKVYGRKAEGGSDA